MTLELLTILLRVEDRLGLLEIVRHSRWHLVVAETLHGCRALLNNLRRLWCELGSGTRSSAAAPYHCSR
jgi:hypothetical protein